MICIVHDLEDDRWLRYVIQEFCRITGACFRWQTAPVGSDFGCENIVYYTRGIRTGLCIPNRSGTEPDGITERLDDGVFIHNNSGAGDFPGPIPYDIFWNIFINLSRYEEYLSEIRGYHIGSYCQRHPRRDRTTFLVPIVNIMCMRLKVFLEDHFAEAEFASDRQAGIECSHDVDYIKKTVQLRLKQTVFNVYHTLKAVVRPRSLPDKVFRTAAFIFRNTDYRQLGYWTENERKKGLRSIFYVYAGGHTDSFRTWLIDPQYRIEKDRPLQEDLKRLLAEGFEIGLHGSIRSATDAAVMAREKERLEHVLGTDIRRVRQHWLTYREEVTPYIHEKYFSYDSTLGWNDAVGFRAGCYSTFHPYDHRNQRPFGHLVIPQIIMDANVYEYGKGAFGERRSAVMEMVGMVSRDPAAHAAISWHQRTCTPDYNWHHLYNDIMDLLKGKDAA